MADFFCEVQQEVRPLPLYVPVRLPALAGGPQPLRVAGMQGDDVVRPRKTWTSALRSAHYRVRSSRPSAGCYSWATTKI